MGITKSYAAHAQYQPNKIAIKIKDREVTYKEWYRSVCQVANWLHKEESANKKIAILLDNSVEFLQIFAGSAMAGWICVPLDPKWNSYELEERLQIVQPSIIVVAQHKRNQLPQTNSKVFSISTWSERITNASITANCVEKVGELPFYMGFTSGSTGKAKAFLRSQQSWVESFACNVYDFHMEKEEAVLLAGTFVHSLFLYGAMSALFLGQTIHMTEKFIPNRVLSILEKESISVMYTVPTMLESLYKEKRVIEREIKIISSGAKWEAEAKQKIKQIFPKAKRFEFYGASELSFVTALSHHDNENKPSSVGRPCHNVKISIRNGDGQEVEQGKVGTIYVKSEQFFMGYIIDNKPICHVTSDGWMTVHDVGYVDEDGFLYIVGREKNMIIYGGINIFPEEIERVLQIHPNVDEVVVVGKKDVYWGEKPVVLVKGAVSKQELKQLCLGKLSSYKIPTEWYFVDAIPHTSSGKVARAEAKEIVEKQEFMYE
ncbi:putative acyl--CoA ligase YhfT [Bacillus rhizoplanae]|uniref:Acyl--CoA ligase YhfT n=1 Tax=Bacillus rhizoplanae TaxID=2880966 RepID=A0ABN8A3L1_9BACI|nr:acyl-CoA synthetase [Bacillus rhizoplanae]CAG9613506.1 putative acyl--CoA ligase YhfT [Bacillus rhizoplanae]